MQLVWTLAAAGAFLSTLPFFALPSVPMGGVMLLPAVLYTMGSSRPDGRWPASGALVSLLILGLLGVNGPLPFTIVALAGLPSLLLATKVVVTGQWSFAAKRWVPPAAMMAVISAFAEGAWLLHRGGELPLPAVIP